MRADVRQLNRIAAKVGALKLFAIAAETKWLNL
jgi:hypothetical protein